MTAPALFVLPEYTGGRRRAELLLEQLPHDLRGLSVTVDCRHMVSGTESFADEMIEIILCKRGAQRLKAINVDSKFAAWLHASADDKHVSDRLMVDRQG